MVISSNNKVDKISSLYFSWKSCVYISLILLLILVYGLVYENRDIYLPGVLWSNNRNSRITTGLVSSILTYSVISIYVFPNGVFNWPNYGFWKIAFGSILLYLQLLIFLLFQSMDDIKGALKHIDPSLRSTYEVNYAAGNSCSLFDSSKGMLSNVRSRIDTFVVAHFIGWGVKTLILRDNFLIWFNSIFFELLEITFRHLLPNFYECWWDHLLLDIFGCNLLGIVVGNILINKLGLVKYRWHTIDTEYNDKSVVIKSGVLKWPPILSTLRGYFSFIVLTIVVQLIDLNYFFFKAEFSMPVSHWIFMIRTPLLAICGSYAARELYETLSTGSSLYYGKINIQCLVLVAVILSETLLCWRFRYSLNAKTLLPSKSICIVWLFLLLFFVSVLISLLVKKAINNKRIVKKD